MENMSNVDDKMDTMDVRVLSTISGNPVGTIRELSEAVGLSQTGFSKRLRSLGERGILYPGFARAHVSYAAVGLELVFVQADVAPPYWQTFERLCDAHPYTQYRIRCMGRVDGNSFITLFAIPAGTKSDLLAFLESVQDEGILGKYTVSTPISKPRHPEFDFAFYDLARGNWKVDWGEWEASMDTRPSRSEHLAKPILHTLDSTDMKVLRLLSMDARAEKWKIAEKVGIKDYELSRRMKNYHENNIIDGYRIIHERNIAGMALTVALFAKTSFRMSEKVGAAVSALPFQGGFYALEDGFAYIGNVPPNELGRFSGALERYCQSVELRLCDYSSSMRYLFDNEPSNFVEGHGWANDQAFLVEKPLAALRPIEPGAIVQTRRR